MLEDIQAGLRLRSGKRRFRLAFATLFGSLWLAVEPAGLFFPDQFEWGWAGYLGLVGGTALAALFMARPPVSISRSLPPTNVKIEVRVGDVLDQRGNVIIGAADTFDTDFADDIISPASVQGQLLTKTFAGDRVELDRQIEATVGAGEHDAAKTFGKRGRHPIGTVAVVRAGESRFFLPAFSHMSATLPAHVTSSADDLQVALARTWQKVNQAGQAEPVHVPVIGSNLGRIGLTKTLLIQMIVLSFIAATLRGGPRHLTVWIREQDRREIDLIEIDDWLRGVCVA